VYVDEKREGGRGGRGGGGERKKTHDMGESEQAQQRQMALALLEAGQTFKAVAEEHLAKNPSESGSPIKIE
jgi:hypothetical protein